MEKKVIHQQYPSSLVFALFCLRQFFRSILSLIQSKFSNNTKNTQHFYIFQYWRAQFSNIFENTFQTFKKALSAHINFHKIHNFEVIFLAIVSIILENCFSKKQFDTFFYKYLLLSKILENVSPLSKLNQFKKSWFRKSVVKLN